MASLLGGLESKGSRPDRVNGIGRSTGAVVCIERGRLKLDADGVRECMVHGVGMGETGFDAEVERPSMSSRCLVAKMFCCMCIYGLYGVLLRLAAISFDRVAPTDCLFEEGVVLLPVQSRTGL